MCSQTAKYALMPCKLFGKALQLPPEFSEIEEKIKNFEIRDNDVFVTGYPKSGTTWLSELVWLVQNNFDFERAKIRRPDRVPHFEAASFYTCFRNFYLENYDTKHLAPMIYGRTGDNLKFIANILNNRVISTHLPWDFLPKQIINGQKSPRIIYVMRDPKQVVISYYYQSIELFPAFKGSLDDFVDAFIEGKLLYGDYFNITLSYWYQRNQPNVLVVTYEEMHQDLEGIIKKVAEFLGKTYTHNDLIKANKHLSFGQMRDNEAVNNKHYIWNKKANFIREGSVDSYKQKLSPESIEKLDKWIEEKGKGTGLQYII